MLTVTIGTDKIGCTANHPFWSEDRQEFVEAGHLQVGERVRTRLDEVAAVVSIKPRPPTAWVYNLEVQGEHVYEVGPSGVLVHNACKDIALGLDPHFKRLAEMTGAVHWRHWFGEGITRRGVPDLIDGEIARGYKRFGRAFHHAAKRTNNIHFTLDGIEDPIQFAWQGRSGFVRDAAGRTNYTAAELWIISRDKELLKKTIFYRNGQVVPNPFQ